MENRMKIEKIEVLKISSEDAEVFYIIPSGYENSDIQVFESGYEELEARLVSTDKWKNEKKEMKIGF